MYTLLHGAPPPAASAARRKRPQSDPQIAAAAPSKNNNGPKLPEPPPVKGMKDDELPHPPEQPRPSSVAAFSAFRSASPQLLADINRMLQMGLHDLKKKGVDGSVEATLEVYKAAFMRFIDEFNIYRPFLLSVKGQYERALDALGERVRAAATYHVDFAANDEEHAQEVRDLTRKHVVQLNELKEAHIAAARQAADGDRRGAALEAQRDDLRAKNSALQQQLDEARSAIGVLTRALNGLEDEKRGQDLREQEQGSETAFLHSSLQKATADLDKLKREKEDLKELQTFLVSPEEVEKERETVVSCRNEIRRLEMKLRLLGQRYTMLKVAVDAACRRYFDGGAGSAGGRGGAVGGVGSPAATLQLSEREASAAASSQKRKGKVGKGKRKAASARESAKDEDEDDVRRVSTSAQALGDADTSATAAATVEEGSNGGTAAWRRALSANAEAQLAGLAGAGRSPKALIDALCDRVEELRREAQRRVDDYSLRALQLSRSLQDPSAGDEVYDPLDAAADGTGGLVAGGLDDDLAAPPRLAERFQSAWSHHQPRGAGAGAASGDAVAPLYLRSTSAVQNLFFSCRDVVAFVREIAAAKMRSNAEAAEARARGQAAMDGEMEQALLAEEQEEAKVKADTSAAANAAAIAAAAATGDHDGDAPAAVADSGPTAEEQAATAAARRAMLANFRNSLKISGLRHADRIEPDKEPFHNFFELFLKQKFKNPRRLIEVATNILESLKKYAFDSDCRIFLAVLHGEVSEDIWGDQDLLLGEILEEVRKEPRLKGPMYATSALAKEAAKEESRKVSFDAFLKAVRRALPTKSDRSHGKLAKALALDVQASRGVDFESILGVTDPPAHALAAPTPAGGPAAAASAVAVVASKYPEPEPPRYLTASDGYVRKKSRFMELLHLQHLAEVVEHGAEILACIDDAYADHLATLAEQRAQAAMAVEADRRAREIRRRNRKGGGGGHGTGGGGNAASKTASRMKIIESGLSLGVTSQLMSKPRGLGLGGQMASGGGLARSVAASSTALQHQTGTRKALQSGAVGYMGEDWGDDGDDDGDDDDDDEEGEAVPSMPLRMFRAALVSADGNKSRADVNKLLAYCTKLTVEEMLLMEARRTAFSVQDVKNRIRMKVVRKSRPMS